jgi:hypothetical protein
VDQVDHALRLEADAALLVLDLLRNPNHAGHLRSLLSRWIRSTCSAGATATEHDGEQTGC